MTTRCILLWVVAFDLAIGLGACRVAQAMPLPRELPAAHEMERGIVVPCRAGQYERRAQRLAGFQGWVRVDAYLGPEQSWDYTAVLDSCIRQADARGRVLVTLLDIGTDDRPDRPNVGRFTHGVERLAARYRGQVDAWEVWNEPNHPFFGVGMTGEDYATLLAAAYSAVKRGDPGALVVAGGTSSVDLPFVEQLLAAGAPFDVMGAHPYEEAHGAPGTTPTGIAALPALRASMIRHGRHEPIWVTELGWPGGGHWPEAEAMLEAQGEADVVLAYDWSWA